ncbi:sulfur carrier protein ThiS [Vibrio lentus]|nr:sulfur carrier protein ThiS [Vibrio lentus]
MSHITISINEQIRTSSTLVVSQRDIIQVLALHSLGCVFAINNAVIPRSQWQQTVVNEGDAIILFSSHCRANHVNYR